MDLPEHTCYATSDILYSMWADTRDIFNENSSMYSKIIAETLYDPNLQLRFFMNIERELELEL